MSELAKEAWGPTGDASRHLPLQELEEGWRKLPAPPKDEGRLSLIVRRRADGVRETAETMRLDVEEGLPDDLSAANLPVGTRLAVGEAVVGTTAEPHDGCRTFQERFGQDALRFVQAKATRRENRCGAYWKVIEGGEARVGSPVRVLVRGGPQ